MTENLAINAGQSTGLPTTDINYESELSPMNASPTTFKSRWGFHPCDYELFRKLKSLHKWFWQTAHDFHRWHRWWRKQPPNRIGREPMVCSIFLTDRPWYKPAMFHGVSGYKLYPKTLEDHGMVALYQAARIPQAEPVALFDAEMRQRIEKLYLEVAKSFMT